MHIEIKNIRGLFWPLYFKLRTHFFYACKHFIIKLAQNVYLLYGQATASSLKREDFEKSTEPIDIKVRFLESSCNYIQISLVRFNINNIFMNIFTFFVNKFKHAIRHHVGTTMPIWPRFLYGNTRTLIMQK